MSTNENLPRQTSSSPVAMSPTVPATTHAASGVPAASSVPYFPPPPTSPFSDISRDPVDRAEEGALFPYSI